MIVFSVRLNEASGMNIFAELLSANSALEPIRPVLVNLIHRADCIRQSISAALLEPSLRDLAPKSHRFAVTCQGELRYASRLSVLHSGIDLRQTTHTFWVEEEKILRLIPTSGMQSKTTPGNKFNFAICDVDTNSHKTVAGLARRS